MSSQPYEVLFLCTGNSARSILAESILNRLGAGRFKAYSAGSMPSGKVNPFAIKLLESLRYPTDGLFSKSWDEFAKDGAREFDFIITVCDNAAGEVCPIWPGKPMRAHWGIPDPAATTGSDTDIALAFADSYRMLSNRISLMINLPIEKLDRMSLKRRIDDIGQTNDAPQSA